MIDSFRRELWTLMGSQTVKTRGEAAAAVAAAARLAQQRLGMQPTAVVLEYLCGATNALDLYSTYLTPDQLNEVYAQIEGNFVGLGVELKAQDGGLTIVRVISGSPAEEAGVRPGDRIFAVDGRSTASLSTDQAANLLQGPEGSRVATDAGRARPDAAARWSSQRRVVEVPSVDHVKIVDPQYGVGYFRLTCFQKTTARDLDAALWKLHGEGMTKPGDRRPRQSGRPAGFGRGSGRPLRRSRRHRLDARPDRPGRLHLLGPRAGQVAECRWW